VSAARVFIDGEIVDQDAARVSAFDASVQHGVGLFETMRARTTRDGVVVEDLDDHLDRIQASASELGLSDDLRTGPLGEAVERTVRESGLGASRVRLTITGGDLNLLQSTGRSGHAPTVLIQAQPRTAYPDAMFEHGVAATVARARANPLDPTAGHKTINYWWRLRELQNAAGKGAGEAVVFTVDHGVCGGCVSNIFALVEGVLVTPIARGEEQGEEAAPSPVLPGITRRRVLEASSSLGIATEARRVTAQDLLGAEEVFLTNSSWGVLPIVRLEAETIGDGSVGAATRALRARVVQL